MSGFESVFEEIKGHFLALSVIQDSEGDIDKHRHRRDKAQSCLL